MNDQEQMPPQQADASPDVNQKVQEAFDQPGNFQQDIPFGNLAGNAHIRENVTNHFHYHFGNSTHIENMRGNVGDHGTYYENAASPGRHPDPQKSDIKKPDLMSYEAVESWFFSNPDLNLKIHVLVVAMFGGNTERFIQEVKKQLQEMLSDPSEEKPKLQNPFARRHKDDLFATATKSVRLNADPTSAQVIVFDEPEIQEIVLNFLSCTPELRDLRQKLETWLEQISIAHDSRLSQMGATQFIFTRRQAALVLGEFVKNDYEYYKRKLIIPWSRADPYYQNAIVGWILLRVAIEPNSRDRIFDLVGNLIQSDNISQFITGILACTPLGFVDLERSLKLIGLAMARTLPVFDLLRISMLFDNLQTLYCTATNADMIIDQFAEWQRVPQNKPADKARQNISLAMFLMLIENKFNDDLLPVADQDRKDGLAVTKKVPKPRKNDPLTVWRLVKRRRESSERNVLQANVVYLVKQCFMHSRGSYRDAMSEIIENWIREADHDKTLYTVIVQTLENLQKDKKYSAPQIATVIKSPKFKNSPTAIRLRHNL